MRKLLLLCVPMLILCSSFSVPVSEATPLTLAKPAVLVPTSQNWADATKADPAVSALPEDMLKMKLDEFLSLTPSKYKALTGHRLGLKNSLALKAAQKIVKKKLAKGSASDLSKGVYILLAILGLGWLAMGLLSDWEGSDWIVNLILTVLCWLPGFIHAMIKMKKYYS